MKAGPTPLTAVKREREPKRKPSRAKAAKPRKSVDSFGIVWRLGHPVMDAPKNRLIAVPLTEKHIKTAEKNRGSYDIDDPENFSECVLACMVTDGLGCEVEIVRSHAYLHFPGEEFTLRYIVSSGTAKLVRLNDAGRFELIKPGTQVIFRPPSASKTLKRQRQTMKSYSHRQAANGKRPKTGPHPDPYKGILRHGVHAPRTMGEA